METDCCVVIQNSTDAAEARRAASELADRLGFDETEAGKAALIATEGARNLLKHAGGGEVLILVADGEGPAGLQILCIDKGPGIENVGRAFQDGYSTSGTPGTGLGAIARLSTLHDVYTQRGAGTVLLAEIRARGRGGAAAGNDGFEAGAVSAPKKGEPVSGDAWAFQRNASGGRLIVADGLGHGLLAADAARTAVRIAMEQPSFEGPRLMERIHEALRPTRGAAVAVAEIHAGTGVVQFTGIGNIAGRTIAPDGRVQHMVSHPGTAGHEAQKIADFRYPWNTGSVLVLHSDGVSGSWSLDRYPGLASRHPTVIAGVLYRDYHRERDDATVTVVAVRKRRS